MIGAAVAYVVVPDAEREPPAGRRWIALGALSIGFHVALVFSGLVPNLVSRPLHLALALPWILLAGERADGSIGRGRLYRLSGLLLAVLGIAACLWVAWRHDALADQYGYLSGGFQVAVGAVLLAVVLETARRAIGWPLPASPRSRSPTGCSGSTCRASSGTPACRSRASSAR